MTVPRRELTFISEEIARVALAYISDCVSALAEVNFDADDEIWMGRNIADRLGRWLTEHKVDVVR